MIMNCYTLYNVKSRLHDGIMLFNTDEHATFELSQKIPPARQSVNQICCIGTFDISSGIISPSPIYFLDWESIDQTPINSAPVHQSSISHESPQVQENKFLEKTASIGVKTV